MVMKLFLVLLKLVGVDEESCHTHIGIPRRVANGMRLSSNSLTANSTVCGLFGPNPLFYVTLLGFENADMTEIICLS